ncbi:MAG TPA: TIGR00341 family protein [Roseiarcus sp.]|nr:TIGR00341 family protein [Roseiarcus sp.]
MAFKLIEVATPKERVRAITSIAEEMKVTDVYVGPPLGDGRHPIRLLVGEIDRQALLDRLQSALGASENWRIVMFSTDAVIPREPEEKKTQEAAEDKKDKEEEERASREELYNSVASGARVNSNFVLLVILSTVVASVGLYTDNVAVVIGAMVIAPLLGPHVAFAFAAAIGDRALMLSAAKSGVLGLVLSVAVAGALALVVAPDVNSAELLARTSLHFEGIVLALASGAAAALSVTTGLPATLVGVMVAVALLPPAATLGIMVAARQFGLAAGAAMLVSANIACINIAAQVVFIAKGIRPRRWHERKSARRAIVVNMMTWFVLLTILVGVIYLRQSAGK